MTIEVIAHPGSSQRKIVVKDNGYHLYIHAQPEKGKANEECIKLLTSYFNLGKKDISILRGETNRKKVIEIREPDRTAD